jgi:hypothetical protein
MTETQTKSIDREAAPDSWLCIDCGFNTGPGMLTRADLQKALDSDNWPVYCRINQESEVYTVHDAVWDAAGIEPFGGCLCIGCLEQRLGRKLKPWDFPLDRGFNRPDAPGTQRLLKRRGKRT